MTKNISDECWWRRGAEHQHQCGVIQLRHSGVRWRGWPRGEAGPVLHFAPGGCPQAPAVPLPPGPAQTLPRLHQWSRASPDGGGDQPRPLARPPPLKQQGRESEQLPRRPQQTRARDWGQHQARAEGQLQENHLTQVDKMSWRMSFVTFYDVFRKKSRTSRVHHIQRPCLDFEKMQQVRWWWEKPEICMFGRDITSNEICLKSVRRCLYLSEHVECKLSIFALAW